jgi:hypothetical protein
MEYVNPAQETVGVHNLVAAGFQTQVRLFDAVGAEKTRERLITDWATQGVVGALILSIVYDSLLESPIDEDDYANYAIAFAYFMSITGKHCCVIRDHCRGR